MSKTTIKTKINEFRALTLNNSASPESVGLMLDEILELTAPPYKIYSCLLTQYGENAPTAKVLENTFGFDMIWSRTKKGEYLGTMPNSMAFADYDSIAILPTIPKVQFNTSDGNVELTYNMLMMAYGNDDHSICINTYNITDFQIGIGTPTKYDTDDYFFGQYFEVRVYDEVI